MANNATLRAAGACGLLMILAAGCGLHVTRSTTGAGPAAAPTSTSPTTGLSGTIPTTVPPPTTTTIPCSLSGGGASGATVPVNQVCSAAGAPHFGTPQAAMIYLASAWNAGNVQEIDYVTDPAGREQMNSMASLMVNLQFKYCTENPAGDYTCYFTHDIAPSTSPTTYPNPMHYPPGEAVFTVAPADAPGWYLTMVLHCG